MPDGAKFAQSISKFREGHMTTRQIPSEEQVIGWMDSLSNWGRWGADDQMGTLIMLNNT